MSILAGRCDAVFRDEQGKPRKPFHEWATESYLYGGISRQGFCREWLLVLVEERERAWIRCQSVRSELRYIRSTELVWDDNTTFKRSVKDLPVAARCVAPNAAGPEIQVADTTFQYFSSCSPYKTSNLGTALNDLDAPLLMDTGGNIGQVMTRVLHYRYNCDSAFENCGDEERFFLAAGYGLWQWKHYHDGTLVNSTLINNIEPGTASGTLPCSQSYE